MHVVCITTEPLYLWKQVNTKESLAAKNVLKFLQIVTANVRFHRKK